MAHFAELDNNNLVINVEVVNNEIITDNEGNEQEQLGVDFLTKLHNGGWYKQTSYNGSFRSNFAGVGDTYNTKEDVFIEPQPYPSWVLDSNFRYIPPVPHPNDGTPYTWNEETLSWIEVKDKYPKG